MQEPARPSLLAAKAELRRTMRERLRALRLVEKHAHSWTICAAVKAHPAWAQANVVGMFDPLGSEPFVEWLRVEAPPRFAYPRIAGAGLEMVEVQSLGELQKVEGCNFREPRAGGAALTRELDVILVPGLAFTRRGERLGRGGGYYDRLLASLPSRTVKLGVCFEVQIVEALPSEAHDCRVDAVITEQA